MSDDVAPRNKGQAMRDLIAWADSAETAKALEAMKLLELSDEDIEAVFSRSARVVRIPWLGRVR
jgi:hypothetical protein